MYVLDLGFLSTVFIGNIPQALVLTIKDPLLEDFQVVSIGWV